MFALSLRRVAAFLVLPFVALVAPLAAQDTRTVTEPSFPASCSVLTAQLTSVNRDLASADENSFDTARIQSAIDNCPAGQAVELAGDPLGKNAFLIQPIHLDAGVTLLVDAGVTVFASRNPRDYDVQENSCGIVSSSSAGCQPIIKISSASNTAVMGFGRIDGRGGDTLIGPGSPVNTSWWDLASQAQQQNLSQFVPQTLNISNSNNVTLYKITLKNSPTFHVATSGLNGFTVWGIKIVTPFTSRNTDGVDPGNSTNVTITNSYLSDGDDEIAVGASHQGSSNITITNDHLYDGHGVSIGSYTTGGVSNMLVDHVYMAGDAADSNANGIRIKSSYDRGGTLTNIRYQNMCVENVRSLLQFNPQYNTNSGTLIPYYQSIALSNIHFLTEGTVELDGADSQHPLGLSLNNVVFDALKASDLSPAPQYANIALGPYPSSTNLVSNLSGTGVTVTSNVTLPAAPAFDCSSAFVYLAGELTGPSDAGASPGVNGGQVVNMIAIVQPTMAGATLPTGTITITENGTAIGSATLGGSTDLVEVALTNVAPGAHTYSATYSGDSNYAPLTFGSYSLNVNNSSRPGSQITLSGAPAGVTYGAAIPLTIAVAGNAPGGTAEVVQGNTVIANLTLSSGTANYTLPNLPAGNYQLRAVYLGDANNAASFSAASALTVAPAATAISLSASGSQINYGNTVTLIATVSSPAGVPPGSVSFFDGQSHIGTATLSGGVATVNASLSLGQHSVSATYIASQNFVSSSSSTQNITVNPSAVAILSVLPEPLPYTISTIAGGATTNCATGTGIGDGCPATQAMLSTDLRAVASDAFGNIYLTDTNNNRIRKVSAGTGIISTFAGGGMACAAKTDSYGDGCPAAQTTNFNHPRGLWADVNGNVFIAGYNTNLIQEVQAATGKMIAVAGQITAGAGVAGTGADNVAATASALKAPRGVWTDLNGNVYIADTSNNRVRVVYAAGSIPNVATPVVGNIYTLAGNGTAGTTGDGTAANAAGVELNNTQGGITDINGNVFIADGGGRVRVIYMGGNVVAQLIATENPGTSAQAGYIYSIAGGGSKADSVTPALASSVSVGGPQKLAVDASGNLYISDSSANAVHFLDIRTGFLRLLAGGVSASCPSANDSVGDGCPATQAVISAGGNGIGVALDGQGNLYITDTSHQRIRKVSINTTFNATAVNTPASQPMLVHFIAGDAPAASNAFVLPATYKDFNAVAPTCTTNPDTTVDCFLQLQFAPQVPGQRSAPFTITSSAGSVNRLGLTGTALGAAGAIDPAMQVTVGSNLVAEGVAVDSAQNVYVADASSGRVLKYAPGAPLPVTLAGGLSSPRSVAVDATGNVYVADSGTATVQRIAPDGTLTSVGANWKTPEGVAVDASGNIYVADAGQPSIVEVAPNLTTQMSLGSGFTAATSVAVDAAFNVYVADKSAGTVTRISQGGVSSAITSGASVPSAVATDAAGNLYVTDVSLLEVFLVPGASGTPTPIAANLQSPQALAVDGAGNVYVADTGKTSVLELVRTQGALSFSDTSTILNATLSSIGNQPIIASGTGFTQSDASDFSLSTAGAGGCQFAAAIAAGSACTLSAQFTPQHLGVLSDTATLTGNYANLSLASPQSLQLTLSGTATSVTAPTTLNLSINPSAPVYGQSISVSGSVTGAGGTPAGTVTLSIDSSSFATVNVAPDGTFTAGVPAISAGPHMLTAVYTGSAIYAGSSRSLNFSVTGGSSTISWNPPVTTIPYGTSLATILNPTASIPGSFAYTAKQGAGAAIPVTGASILPAGAYSITAKFTPADATDYSGTSAQISLTVTKANTSTGAGLTQNVIASDGSGNYTTVNAALQSLPGTGGALYVKPGTYTEQVIVKSPNVALYGLGGDASKVIITDDLGAGPNNYGPQVGDQGSATVQALGDNFYADHLTLQNTFDMEHNQDTTPNAQALALWVTGDRALFNGMSFVSRQDTIYGGSKGCTVTTCTPARQYFYNAYVEGNVDYIFGDGATVFESSTIHTVYHANASNEATITAQNKKYTGAGSYLSGEVFSNSTLTAESDAGPMSSLYLGRPYGTYSTNVFLNTNMQAPINPAGWIEFTPGTTNNLPTSYYAEYNSTGLGAKGPRESYALQLTTAQAAQWQPLVFLAGSDNWNPQTALTQAQAAVVPASKSLTVAQGSKLTLVTFVAPAVGGVPTGTVTFLDGTMPLTAVPVDASGEATFNAATLGVGTHAISVQYSGDANFVPSNSIAVTVTITGQAACASDLSSQVAVTRGGYRLNHATNTYAQTVTVTNSSAASLSTVSFVLDNLSANATLANAGGATQCTTPSGSPWIGIPGTLAPGQSGSVFLSFHNPSNAAISYSSRVLAGSGAQ